MTALDEIKASIGDNKSFVLQGGAGSGKTEALKQTLEFISDNYPEKKIACITYTNLAADEIKSRVGVHYTVSTIHSFLNGLIKDYKKNMHQVIHALFQINLMERQKLEYYDGDEKVQKTKEHEKYKKIYNKYVSSLFTVKNERAEKVEGKKVYDQDPQGFNAALNGKIDVLNAEILKQIQEKDYNLIQYNETMFNNFHDLTFGHDGLLDIASLLFEKYSLLGKILQDKFDCIFIDEYQDANDKNIDILLNKLPAKDKTLIGLFGDSMQAIYEDGIGDVEEYVIRGGLRRIDKKDNYRCSEQVKDFINKLRNDGLMQEVAFKKKKDGAKETIDERQGSVVLYYSFYKDKPNAYSSQEKKDEYIKAIDALILEAIKGQDNFRQLKLTNKSIAYDAGFGKLYGIFSDRYVEPVEYMDRHFTRLQFTDLIELCMAYKPLTGSPNYNLVLSKLKKQGLSIKSISDKKDVKEKFDKIINSDKGAFQTLKDAFNFGLLNKAERHSEYLEQRDRFFDELRTNANFKNFKTLYLDGKNTFNRIKNDLPGLEQEDFNEFQRDIKRETFYNDLFSGDLKFKEIVNYFHYQNEDTPYITMHKTKGSGIENVLVVLDEYFWSKYDFKTVFSNDHNLEKKKISEQLFYVACSRAKTNLRCVRLVSTEEEEKTITQFFEHSIKVQNHEG
jgi:DNA helicase-2/ATP-dependent DNA helicase PcrA